MERLTNKKEADAQRKAYQKRIAQGYPRNIQEERFLRLAAYEDTGLEPEGITTHADNWCAFFCNMCCNLDGDWCPEGPGCPMETNPDKASHLCDLVQAEKDVPLTMEDLREMDGPVWVACKPIEGGDGYWCLCQRGTIITPAGTIFNASEIPHWVFYRRKPEELRK